MTKRQRSYRNAVRQCKREDAKIKKCRCPQVSTRGYVRNCAGDILVPARQFQAKCAADYAKIIVDDNPVLKEFPGVEGGIMARVGQYGDGKEKEFVLTLIKLIEILIHPAKIKVEGYGYDTH